MTCLKFVGNNDHNVIVTHSLSCSSMYVTSNIRWQSLNSLNFLLNLILYDYLFKYSIFYTMRSPTSPFRTLLLCKVVSSSSTGAFLPRLVRSVSFSLFIPYLSYTISKTFQWSHWSSVSWYFSVSTLSLVIPTFYFRFHMTLRVLRYTTYWIRKILSEVVDISPFFCYSPLSFHLCGKSSNDINRSTRPLPPYGISVISLAFSRCNFF